MPNAKIELRSGKELRSPKRASRPKTDANQDDLRESIGRFGVVQPIVAKPDGEVIIGQRRSEIAKRLGIEVPVIVREDLRDELDAWEARLSEELAHKPWEELPLAEEVRRLYEKRKESDPKLSQAKFAKRLGVSEDTLQTRLRLAGLPNEVKDKVESGRLSVWDAYSIDKTAQLTEKEKIKLAEKVAEGTVPGGRKLEGEVLPLLREAPKDVRTALIHHRDTTYEDTRRYLARQEAKKAEGAEHTLHGLAALVRQQFRNWRGALRGTRDIVPLFPEAEWVSIEALIFELVEELNAWRKVRRDREEMTKAKALSAKPERVIKMVEDREERWASSTEE